MATTTSLEGAPLIRWGGWRSGEHHAYKEDRRSRLGAEASIAGLLAARVLADAFTRVTVFDLDTMPEIGIHQRGAPHDRHLHVLHPRGRQVLDEFFPGFTAQLIEQGAASGDALGNGRWQLSGHQLRQVDIGLL